MVANFLSVKNLFNRLAGLTTVTHARQLVSEHGLLFLPLYQIIKCKLYNPLKPSSRKVTSIYRDQQAL